MGDACPCGVAGDLYAQRCMQKLSHENPAIGFLAQARRFSEAIERNELLAPAKTLDQMKQVVFNQYVDAVMCALFMGIVVSMLIAGALSIRRALATSEASTKEIVHDDKGLQPVGPKIKCFGKLISQTAQLMCGMPDYETYVTHRMQNHPDEPMLSRDEFFRERQRARYADGSGRGVRCC